MQTEPYGHALRRLGRRVSYRMAVKGDDGSRGKEGKLMCARDAESSRPGKAVDEGPNDKWVSEWKQRFGLARVCRRWISLPRGSTIAQRQSPSRVSRRHDGRPGVGGVERGRHSVAATVAAGRAAWRRPGRGGGRAGRWPIKGRQVRG